MESDAGMLRRIVETGKIEEGDWDRLLDLANTLEGAPTPQKETPADADPATEAETPPSEGA